MAEEPWYRRYFGADYLRIYRLADTAAQRDFLRRTLPPPSAAPRLLDLPCGHGRHAVWLAERGYRVTGLDLSPTFLGVARQGSREQSAPVALVRGDMRRFPFAAAAFDTAICMFTSLGYFADDDDHQRVLDEFRRVLRSGATFILDLANIDAVRVQPSHSSWSKEGVTVSSEYRFDEATRRATTRRTARFADGREEHYESSVRLFEGVEIEAMLAAAGFGIAARQGDYAGGPVSAALPRRILICRRGEGDA